MLLGFTHFSGGQSKTIKIFGLKKIFDQGTLNSADPESKRL